jgi:hypothetical protein
MNLLETGGIHLFTDNSLDVSQSDVAKWKPGVDSRRDSSDVSSAHQ